MMYMKMPIWRTRKNDQQNPIRTPWQDVRRTRPGIGGKAGISGALEQPGKYLGEYAWRHYGGTEKTRALSWYYQRELRVKYKRWTAYNYGIHVPPKKFYEKKSSNEGAYNKFQTSTLRRVDVRRRQREQRVRNQRWYVAGKRRYKSYYTARKQALFSRYQRKFYKQFYYNRN